MRPKKTGFSSWLENYYNSLSLSAQQDRERYEKEVKRLTKTIATLRKDLKILQPIKLKHTIGENLIENYNSILERSLTHRKGYNIEIKQIDQKTIETKKSKTNKITYKQLLSHKKIDNIIENNGYLCIITKKLKNHEKNTLGRYFIRISIDEKPSIEIRNLDYLCCANSNENYMNGYDHYHISAGNPCLEGYKDVINKYSETRQLYFVIDTIIHFLINGDSPGDYYINKDDWFENREEFKREITKFI